MKKLHILITAFALLMVGVAIYACQKENATASATVKYPVKEGVADRNPNCPNITITNGSGLTICGLSSGAGICTVCGNNSNYVNITTNSAQTYSLPGIDVFSLTNTTGSSINVDIEFNCGSGSSQTFTIPANSTITFSVLTGGSSCCQASVNHC